MAKRVRLIRHTTGGADAFVGYEGEISVDTTAKELRVHDGLTAGGIPHARKDLANVANATAGLAGKMSAAQVVELTAATADIAAETAARIAADSTHTTNIATNASGIATNAGNITSNASDIATSNALDASVAGTAEANKRLILGGTRNIDTLDIALNGLEIAGTPVTKTAAQINALATLTGSEILTNKTLTNPVIQSVYEGGNKAFEFDGAVSGRYLIARNQATYVQLVIGGGTGLISVGGVSCGGTSARCYASNGSIPAILGYNSASSGNAGVKGTAGDSFGVGVRAVEGYSASSAGYGFYASGFGIDYGPFTGAHDGLVAKTFNGEIGDIVADAEILYHAGMSNTIARNVVADTYKQQNVVGVLVCNPYEMEYQGYANEDIDGNPIGDKETKYLLPAALEGFEDEAAKSWSNKYKRITLNALGEGQISVCGLGGNIEAGDLICASAMAGKGCKQDDDLVHNYTVAKARENVTFTSANEVKLVACIYLCG